MLNTLESLFKLARDRKSNPIDGSYTNKLLSDKSLSINQLNKKSDYFIDIEEYEKAFSCSIIAAISTGGISNAVGMR